MKFLLKIYNILDVELWIEVDLLLKVFLLILTKKLIKIV